MATTNLTNQLKTPGVYIEELRKLPPSIAQVETAIPAFVGYTEKAEDDRKRDLARKPQRITSLLEYELYFGKPQVEKGLAVKVENDGKRNIVTAKVDPEKGRAPFNMYYGLQMFFANGGGPCWIVSAGLYEKDGGLVSKKTLSDALVETAKINEITLYVFPDAQGLDNPTDFYDLYNEAIKLCVNLQDRFTVMDVWQDRELAEAQWFTNIETLRSKVLAEVDDIKYAAAYYPNLDTNLDLYYGGEGDGDKFVTVDFKGAAITLAELKTADNALYFSARSALRNLPCELPPSPAVVGIYAKVDAARGVWKAPANASLTGVIEPKRLLTDEEQGKLNVDALAGKSVNVIRYLTGRGVLIWGARTLAGNDNEWRYVPVRRFFNMVEESTKNAAGQFVFDPNDRNTWTRVRSMIENFLTKQWKAGALMGTTTEEAYYVRVGLNETMTELDIFEGRMIIEIGMAVVRPAEFIILQFSHKMLSES